VVKLALPKDAGNGQHKLSVQNASNGVIGWTTLKVKADRPSTGIPALDWLIDLLDRILGWF
jgi:5'-nucleotidase